MAARHGNNHYPQVLINNAKYESLVQCAPCPWVRKTALVGDAAYKVLTNIVDQEFFQAAILVDDATWKQSVRNSVEGQMENKANTQSENDQ